MYSTVPSTSILTLSIVLHYPVVSGRFLLDNILVFEMCKTDVKTLELELISCLTGLTNHTFICTTRLVPVLFKSMVTQYCIYIPFHYLTLMFKLATIQYLVIITIRLNLVSGKVVFRSRIFLVVSSLSMTSLMFICF